MVAKALREEMEVTLAKSSAELLATELKEREKTEMGFELHRSAWGGGPGWEGGAPVYRSTCATAWFVNNLQPACATTLCLVMCECK